MSRSSSGSVVARARFRFGFLREEEFVSAVSSMANGAVEFRRHRKCIYSALVNMQYKFTLSGVGGPISDLGLSHRAQGGFAAVWF